MHRTLKPLIFAFLALPLVLPASPAQAAPAGSNDPSRAVPGEVVVGFAGDTSKRARERAAARVDATSRTGVARGSGEVVQLMELPGGISNAGAIDRLRAGSRGRVRRAELDLHHARPRTTRTTPNGSLWGMYGDAEPPGEPRTAARPARRGPRGTPARPPSTSASSTRASSSTTPTSTRNVWTNPFDPVDGVDNDGNGYVDDIHGWDFAGNDNTVYDGGSGTRRPRHARRRHHRRRRRQRHRRRRRQLERHR